MKKLASGELYKLRFKNNSEFEKAVSRQSALSQNVGVIAPEHIEVALADLRTRSKKLSSCAFLSEALALFENRGLIRLFNLSDSKANRSRIPTLFPYFPGRGRERTKEGSEDNTSREGFNDVIFVNMYRIGHWSLDGERYEGLNAITDLYSCLESGVIGYKLSIQHMADKFLDDKNVVEYLTKLYVYLFSKVVIGVKNSFGENDFQKDSALFTIARFFLLYVLEKSDSEFTDNYAFLATSGKTTLSALKTFEDMKGIDYTSLSNFLKTFGEAFFNEEPIYIMEFETKWVTMYGDATGLAVEYVPYLLHFLFSALHGAVLGGGLKLGRDLANLNKHGLPRLYNAVVNVLK